jgi:hypothetical protein
MRTLLAFATAEFTCLASVAAAGGDPTEVGVPEVVDTPADGREVEAVPELPPPQAATSIMATTAASPAHQCRIFTLPPKTEAARPVMGRIPPLNRADGSW